MGAPRVALVNLVFNGRKDTPDTLRVHLVSRLLSVKTTVPIVVLMHPIIEYLVRTHITLRFFCFFLFFSVFLIFFNFFLFIVFLFFLFLFVFFRLSRVAFFSSFVCAYFSYFWFFVAGSGALLDAQVLMVGLKACICSSKFGIPILKTKKNPHTR